MRKLILLACLISTPVSAAFDLEGLLGEIVEEGTKTVINEVVGQKSSLSHKELLELIADNDKRANAFVAENDISSSQSNLIKSISEGCNKYLGKHVEAQQLCEASQQLSIAQSNMGRVNEISLLHDQIKINIQRHNQYIDRYGRDDINQVEVIISDSKLLKVKLDNYQKYRTQPPVHDVIATGQATLANIQNKEAKLARKNRKTDKKGQTKANSVSAEVKAGLPSVVNGVFNKPYRACLAESEKMIDMARLLKSKSMTKAKVKETRAELKEQCGCVYVMIYQNSENASKSGRRALADDLTVLEKNKIEHGERKMSRYEQMQFRSRLNNPDIMSAAYMQAMLKCQ